MSSVADQQSRVSADTGGEHYDAFVSYSHFDRDFAVRLKTALGARDCSLWIDESEIHGGSRWSEELELAIEGSDAFVFLVSPESAKSKECAAELEHAVRLGKRVLPLRVRDTPIEALPAGLASYQLIPSRQLFEQDFEGSLTQLITEIRTDREWVREHTEWGEKAREWEKHNHDPSYLLSGAELEAAERWRSQSAGKQPGLSALHNEFIDSSRAGATRRLRRTRAFVSVALVVALVLAGVALIQREQAIAQQKKASSGELSSDSLLELGTDPQLSLLLAARAAQTSETTAALDALRRAIPANHLLETFRASDGRPLDSAEWGPGGATVLTAGEDGDARLWSVATGRVVRTFPTASGQSVQAIFADGGSEVITWAQGKILVWSLTNPTAPPVTIAGSTPAQRETLAFQLGMVRASPDGAVIATASGPGIAGSYSLWNARTGALLRQLPPTSHSGGLGEAIAFSPNGQRVATGSENGTAQVWDVATGQLVRQFDVSQAASASSGLQYVYAVEFNPQGTALLTADGVPPLAGNAGALEQTQAWNLASGGLLSRVNGGDPAWNPGGDYVITTASDGTSRVWQASDGALVSQLKSDYPISGQALFAPDATTTQGQTDITDAVTGSDLGFGAIWNAISGIELSTLAGDTGAMTPAGFSPSGKAVLTYSSDGAARIWGTGVISATPAPLPARVRQALGAGPAVDAQGGLVNDPRLPLLPVVLGDDPPPALGSQGAMVVLDERSGQTLASLPAAVGAGSAAFDGAGRLMLVTREHFAGTRFVPLPAQLRLVQGGRLLRTLAGTGSLASSGAISPNGELAATVDRADRVAVWDLSTGRRLVLFTGHVGHQTPYGPAGVVVKFSPDSSLILSSDSDGYSYVWNARTGQLLERIRGSAEPAGLQSAWWGGAISPDDALVVTVASWDNSGHVYRIGERGELLSLLGGSEGIDDATFNADGSLIATVSPDGIRLWDTRSQSPIQTLSGYFGTRVAFGSSGGSFVASDGDGDGYTLACDVCAGFTGLLATAAKLETRTFTPAERQLYLGG